MARRGAAYLALFVAVVVVYLCNGHAVGSGDTVPASYLPWSLLREGNFDLDEFPSLYSEQARAAYPVLDGVPYYLCYRDGHYFSAYSPGPALLALPIYGAALLAGAEPDPPTTERLAKLSATLITAASVLLFLLAAELVTTRRWALAMALVYAFGTSSFSISSQALWQHGASQLFVALFVYLLMRGLQDERQLAYAGFAMGIAVAVRSTNLLLVLPAALWILSARRRVIVRFVLCVSAPLVASALYNLLHFGTPLGVPGNTNAPAWAYFVQTPLLEGFTGVLASPSRGLFVYSPILLFALFGIVSVWRSGPAVLKALAVGPILVVLLVGKWFLWWGGHSWGPRLLADTTPVLCFFLYPVGRFVDRRMALKIAFFAAAAISVCTHALGTFLYDGRWDQVADVEHRPEWLRSWADGPLVYYGSEAARALRGFLRVAPIGPTSENSPTLLAATLAPLSSRSEVFGGDAFVVSLLVGNTGRALWLAHASDERGVVQLGWRWYAAGRETSPAGWEPLPANVLPGEAVQLNARISAPSAAGDYELRLDLVSHWVTWFADQGTMPVRIPIRVRPMDAAQLLREPTPIGGTSPEVRITTDRASYRRGDALRLSVDLWNPHRPGRFDAYLLLQASDGATIFYDGQREVGTEGETALPWVKALPMPARATGRFSVPLSKLPPGEYDWHLVLMDTNPRRVAARATTRFSLAP